MVRGRSFVAGLLAVALVAPARAGDDPAETGWTGVYLGGQVGGAAAALPIEYSDDTFWDGLGFRNFSVGGFAGFNLDLGHVGLLGLEAGGMWLGLSNTDFDGTLNATID